MTRFPRAHSSHRGTRSPLLPLCVLAAALLFAAVMAWSAPDASSAPGARGDDAADTTSDKDRDKDGDKGETERRPPKTRAEALARLVNEPGVLINIHAGLFPATWDLTLLGQQATPALRKALMGNTHAAVRWKAAQVLTQLRDSAALPELHQAVTDWNPSVRHQVMRALANVGNSYSVPHLTKRLADPQETLANRVAALHALGQIGDATAAPALRRAYREARRPRGDAGDEPRIRRAALSALWALRRGLPRKTLVAALRRALSDRDPQVVRRAAVASAQLQDRGALPALVRHLNGSNAMLRNVAAYALGHLGDQGAIPELVKAIDQVRSGRLLNNIAFALQRLGDPKLWDHLQRLLGHRQAFIRLNAAFTVGEMRLVRAIAPLTRLLKDPSRAVRAQAVVALAKIDSPRALPALLRLTRGQGAKHRRLALRALMYLSGKKAHRDRYLRLSTAQKYRREAALVLAAKGDHRAAPLLYPLIRRRHDGVGWRSAAELSDPLLVQLTLAQLRTAVERNDVRMLPELLRLLGPRRLRPHARALVGLLVRAWGRLDPKRPSRRGALLAVIRALGHSGQQDVRRWLAPYVHHASYPVRMQARVALARLGDDGSLAHLVGELVNASDHHRPYLASLLGQLPAARIRPAVRKALTEPDPYLRLALGAALFYAGAVQSAPLRAALRSSQAALRKRARRYLVRGLDRDRYAKLRRLRAAAADAQARAELDRLLSIYKPVRRVFRPFVPREVVLH